MSLSRLMHMCFISLWMVLYFISIGACVPQGNEERPSEESLDSLLFLGINQMEELDFNTSISTLHTLNKYAKNLNNLDYEILSIINLGNLYLRYNREKDAVEYFLQAEKLANSDKQTADRFLNTIYNNLGIIYSNNRAFDRALQYFNNALKISIEQEINHRTAINYNNIGSVREKLKENEKALEAFTKAIQYSEGDKDSLNLSHAYNSIGNILLNEDKYAEAKMNYLKAISLAPTEDPFYLSKFRHNLGRAYIHLSRLDSARIYLDQSLNGFIEMQDYNHIVETYKDLYRYAVKKCDTEEAIAHLSESLNWKDSVLQNKTSQWVSELHMNYEYGQKVKEIELLKRKSRAQMFMWIISITSLILLAIFLLYVYKSQNRNLRQKNIILQQEKEMNQLELERNHERQSRLEQEIETNQKINELEQSRLNQEIEYYNRSLSSKALHLAKMNETIQSFRKIISQLSGFKVPGLQKIKKEASSLLLNAESTEREWDSFFMHFEEVHPHFFSGLSEEYDKLNTNDLKLCAYYVIGLSTKEIAQILHISPASVRKRKQRLREKLMLEAAEDIPELLTKYKD